MERSKLKHVIFLIFVVVVYFFIKNDFSFKQISVTKDQHLAATEKISENSVEPAAATENTPLALQYSEPIEPEQPQKLQSHQQSETEILNKNLEQKIQSAFKNCQPSEITDLRFDLQKISWPRIENHHFLDVNKAQHRLQFLGSSESDQVDIKYFLVDNEGLPIPTPLPKEWESLRRDSQQLLLKAKEKWGPRTDYNSSWVVKSTEARGEYKIKNQSIQQMEWTSKNKSYLAVCDQDSCKCEMQ
ncbi:MAG: hypothetical protein ACOYOK_12225 [Pseudobdellovibrionaceae bacterium]